MEKISNSPYESTTDKQKTRQLNSFKGILYLSTILYNKNEKTEMLKHIPLPVNVMASGTNSKYIYLFAID